MRMREMIRKSDRAAVTVAVIPERAGPVKPWV
jgi:hypothetical protein